MEPNWTYSRVGLAGKRGSKLGIFSGWFSKEYVEPNWSDQSSIYIGRLSTGFLILLRTTGQRRGSWTLFWKINVSL